MANSSHNESFISKGAFKKLCQQHKEEKRDVKRWIELPTDGTVYKIISSEKKQGKFGDCYILTIKDKSGEESKVWAPRGLQKEAEEEAQKSKPRDIYFCSLGQNKKQDGSGHIKNEYDSCYR
jgi:hypothetical protein